MKVLKIKTLCLLMALLIAGSGNLSAIEISNFSHFTSDSEHFEKPKKKKKKKKKKNKKKEKSKTSERSEDSSDEEAAVPFKDKLWYGGGFNLGFGATQNTSVFALGISPMVGYKFWGPLSAGPRVSVTFTNYKEVGFKSAGLFDYELGIFLRSKIWGPLFAHGEISNRWIQYPADYDFNTQKWTKQTYDRANQYIGLGYNNANGGGGYEILVLYNFAIAKDIRSSENPLNLRFGLTWKF